MSEFEQKFMEAAIKQLGSPYIWGGHGDWIWRKTGPVSMAKNGGCPKGFDCAGLVTFCAKAAGGPDLTKTWNAQTMADKLPEASPNDPYCLTVYGNAMNLVSHVAILVGSSVPHLLLQASGGDHTTLTFTDAIKRGALVSLGYRSRGDLLGYRSLAALAKAQP